MRDLLDALVMCVAVALIAAPSTAAALQPTDIQADEGARVAPIGTGDEVLWDHGPAWLGWRWDDSFQTFSGSVSIYFNHTRQGAPEGRPTRLRLVARQLVRRAGQSDQISWADSDRCPALLDLARGFQTLDPPLTVLPGLTWPPEFPVVVLDGVRWTLWSNSAQQTGRYPAYSQFSSNAGAIAAWGRNAQRQMVGCWVERQPSPAS